MGIVSKRILIVWAAAVLSYFRNALPALEGVAFVLRTDKGSRSNVKTHNCTNTSKPEIPSSWCLDEDVVPRFVGKKDVGIPLASVDHYTHAG